jgi:hypothetical protein
VRAGLVATGGDRDAAHDDTPAPELDVDLRHVRLAAERAGERRLDPLAGQLRPPRANGESRPDDQEHDETDQGCDGVHDIPHGRLR